MPDRWLPLPLITVMNALADVGRADRRHDARQHMPAARPARPVECRADSEVAVHRRPTGWRAERRSHGRVLPCRGRSGRAGSAQHRRPPTSSSAATPIRNSCSGWCGSPRSTGCRAKCGDARHRVAEHHGVTKPIMARLKPQVASMVSIRVAVEMADHQPLDQGAEEADRDWRHPASPARD